MKLSTLVTAPDLAEANISDELKQEFTLYRQLKPLVARSLTINHELNNPLAGLLGYLELIQADTTNFTKDQKECLDQIVYCAERLESCVRKLSDIKGQISQEVDLDIVMKDFFPDKH